MAYCSPKAADFVAYRGDVILSALDPAGLAVRWQAANSVRQLDMLRLTATDIGLIEDACNRTSELCGLRVSPSPSIYTLA